MSQRSLTHLLEEIRACRVCAEELPHGPRPVLQAGSGARVVIIGQAPGRRVHESGVPWQDPSGDRLRSWLGLTPEVFYDPDRVALVPMGFCYPGSTSAGDRPPRRECAPLWHPRVLDHLDPGVLRVLIGTYALARYLPEGPRTVTAALQAWREHLPTVVLPHPSPRNQRWLAANPWFLTDLLPTLREQVRLALLS